MPETDLELGIPTVVDVPAVDAGATPANAPLRRRATADSAVHGYPRLAHRLSRDPATFAIFRRFGVLNAKNLLYLQAELAHDEDELGVLEKANCGQGEPNICRVKDLLTAETDSVGGRQWEKMLNIRPKLDYYNKLLLELRQVFALPEPNPKDFEQLWTLLYDKDQDTWLKHPEDIWAVLPEDKERLHNDLVALSVRNVESDKFTGWVIDSLAEPLACRFLPWIARSLPLPVPWKNRITLAFMVCLSSSYLLRRHRRLTSEQKPIPGDDHIEIDDRALNSAAGRFTVVLASLLPTATMFVLNAIHQPSSRLAFVMAFSVVFTMCLAVFTSARRIEIFAAAVSLASVQVVFIGTSNNSSSCSCP
ncbi:hypothetical protein BJ546DRAFT_60568 [Cryomyces antarcticus]